MRGNLVSRPIDEIMREAQHLVNAGVKELLVISQDTSAYGLDVRYRTAFWQGRPLKTCLFDLANALGSLGVWIRLHYVYPYPNVDDIIPLMAEGKVLPYLDIPFQHASPAILRAMGRPAHSENVLQRIRRWREICPDIAIRSTFIVGFPGETRQDFECLLDFLNEAQLDRVGCFTYSPVEGAAANSLPGHVPEEIKQERMATVLVDEVTKDVIIARSHADAPEIDGVVILSSANTLQPGDFVDVRITDAATHDLHATLLENPATSSRKTA
jgi:ribosomal protein S12 methylthiotransferase